MSQVLARDSEWVFNLRVTLGYVRLNGSNYVRLKITPRTFKEFSFR